MLTLLLAALAQDPFPKPGSDPTGMVLDEQSQPLGGAKVELVALADPEAPYAQAISVMLHRTPLPKAVSAKDGTFVLPLTEEQRTLGAGGEGAFWLVVTQPGFREWREPIAQGIAGYLGSRVLLRAERADDPFARMPWPPVLMPGKFFAPVESLAPRADRRGAQSLAQRDDREVGGLVVTVTDASDRPIAGASLRFPNSCHACGELRTKAPLTDATGTLALSGIPVGEHAVIACAPGRLARKETMSVRPGEITQFKLALDAATELRVVTVDEHDQVFAFGELQEGWRRTPRPEPRRWLADSLGRVIIRATADEMLAVISPPMLGISPGEKLDRGSEVLRVRVREPVSVLVETEPIGHVATWVIEARRGPARAITNMTVNTFARPPSSTWLVRAVTRDVEDVWLGAPGSPPIRLRGDELPPRVAGAFDMVIASRKVTRRIPLRVDAGDGAAIPKLTFAAAHMAGDYPIAERAADGSWTFVARDDGEWDCVARRTDGKPHVTFTVPARDPQAPDEPIVVRLIAR